MKLLNFSILKLTLFLIIGILLGNYISGFLVESVLISIASLLVYGFGVYIAYRQLQQAFWVGIALMIAMISLGIVSLKLHEHYNFKNHYSKHHKLHKDSIYKIQFSIREILKSGNYRDKYVINLLKVDTNKVSGKLLLNITKDSLALHLEIDDVYMSKMHFSTIKAPLNPSQFNYKNYANKKHIYHQLFTTYKTLFKIDSVKHSPYGYAALIRKKINLSLEPYGFKTDEIAIINALLLGQRQDMSAEIHNNYVRAGAIHILAVSGLHVGILLMLLNYIFQPLEYFKYGKLIKTILIVSMLWFFAVLAGLSASVVRAATMFTVVAIAINLKRPTNVFNTLAISMFVLLLCKPSFLFDVGFQLSYLAVFAIVTIQPMLFSLYRPRFKLDLLIWNVLTVTFAAQLGVLPISLYYFHQFPGLFFLSNLVIIPFLGILLGFGIFIIIFALLNLLPQVIASFFGKIISAMNAFVDWISHHEDFLFQNISFNGFQLILSYLFIVSSICLIKSKAYKNIISFLIVVLLFQGYLFINSYQSSNNTFIIFHKSRHSILGILQNRQLKLYHNVSMITNEKLINNYKVDKNLEIITLDTIRNVYTFKNKTLLVVDSLGIYKIKSFKADFVLLHNSPRINLARLIDSISPELIISDGSNFKSYQERWAKTCSIKKTPFHQTSEKGAFIYKY